MAKIGKVEIYSYAYEGNYGTNALVLETPLFAIYFSYDTPIALYDKKTDTLYVDTYNYSRTTSTKHRPKAIRHARTAYVAKNVVEDPDRSIKDILESKVREYMVELGKRGELPVALLVAEMF